MADDVRKSPTCGVQAEKTGVLLLVILVLGIALSFVGFALNFMALWDLLWDTLAFWLAILSLSGVIFLTVILIMKGFKANC